MVLSTDYPEIVRLSYIAEPFSSLSHMLSAAVALVWGIGLVRRGQGYRPSLCVFLFGAVFLLSMSGVYHLLERDSTARLVFQRLDHAGIWLLIAGSFTPIHMMLFQRFFWRWGVLCMVWTLAISGLTLKSIYFEAISEELGLALYMGLGWLGVLSGIRATQLYGIRKLAPVVVGGIAYSAGAATDYFRWPVVLEGVIGPHEVFHVGVITGLFFHAMFIRQQLELKRSE